MSIDKLYRAAEAAGFAMATPDDDTAISSSQIETQAEVGTSRAVALIAPRGSADTAPASWTAMTTWLREHLPVVGGRAPA